MLDLEKMSKKAHRILLSISVLGVIVLAAGAALTAMIINHSADWLAGFGSATGPLVLAAIGLLIAVMPWGIMQVVSILHRRANDDRFHRDQMIGMLESQNRVLEKVRDVASLSDAAKQVAYRAKDLDALRSAIKEDLDKGDFEAATMLVNEMERRFGYALEADKLREQINQSSRAAIDQRVNDVVEHVEVLCSRHEWEEATRESERLLRLYPLHSHARNLPNRITQARDDHKRDLLKRWKEASAKDDVDGSLRLLRELDQYLTPAEAEAYKESARDVFRKKLQQLGVQFALHVHDRSWTEALRIGRQIVEEFPNTRMAAEVKERLPILEDKAGQAVGV